MFLNQDFNDNHPTNLQFWWVIFCDWMFLHLQHLDYNNTTKPNPCGKSGQGCSWLTTPNWSKLATTFTSSCDWRSCDLGCCNKSWLYIVLFKIVPATFFTANVVFCGYILWKHCHFYIPLHILWAMWQIHFFIVRPVFCGVEVGWKFGENKRCLTFVPGWGGLVGQQRQWTPWSQTTVREDRQQRH